MLSILSYSKLNMSLYYPSKPVVVYKSEVLRSLSIRSSIYLPISTAKSSRECYRQEQCTSDVLVNGVREGKTLKKNIIRAMRDMKYL
jgi:hypothetical protein